MKNIQTGVTEVVIEIGEIEYELAEISEIDFELVEMREMVT